MNYITIIIFTSHLSIQYYALIGNFKKCSNEINNSCLISNCKLYCPKINQAFPFPRFECMNAGLVVLRSEKTMVLIGYSPTVK